MRVRWRMITLYATSAAQVLAILLPPRFQHFLKSQSTAMNTPSRTAGLVAKIRIRSFQNTTQECQPLHHYARSVDFVYSYLTVCICYTAWNYCAWWTGRNVQGGSRCPFEGTMMKTGKTEQQSSEQDPTPGPPKYEVGYLTTAPWCSFSSFETKVLRYFKSKHKE